MGCVAALIMLVNTQAWAGHVNRAVMAETVEWFVATVPAGKTQVFTVTGPDEDQAAFHIFGADTLSPIMSQKGSTITYTNPNSGNIKNIAILIHSRRANIEGEVLLESFRDGVKVMERDIWLAGNMVQVPCGIGPVHYETAPRPGNQTDTILFGFDSDFNALAFDNDSGVNDASRIAYQEDVCQVLVSHVNGGVPGEVDVYANDASVDYDGDGLGVLLEDALGTCDSLAEFGCVGVFNPQDSDRDGLDDMLEVFGLDSDPPLLMPQWGADPLQKDLFMEVDSHPGKNIALNNAALRTLAGLYGEGPADQLQNPNGQPGVRVHFDNGRTPTNAADQTLFGDWGGSNRLSKNLCPLPANKTKYDAGCLRNEGQDKDMAAHRRGIFYYGVSNPSGGGQASLGAGRGHFGPSALNTAHELGHAIGLGHGGIDGGNCKPHYPSLMNYATLYDAPEKFFSGLGVKSMGRYYAQEMDPFGLSSLNPPQGLSTDHLSNGSWLLDGDGTNADWNADGVFSAVWRLSIQQAVTEGNGGGCGIGAGNPVQFRKLKESDGQLSSASLARLGHYYVSEGEGFSSAIVWVEDGNARFRAVRDDGPLSVGGCDDGCTNLREPITVQGPAAIVGVSAAQFMQNRPNALPTPYFGLALRDDSDQLRFALSRDVQLDGEEYILAQEADSTIPWEFVDLGVTTSTTPEIVQMTVNLNGAMQNALAVVYVDKATSEFHWTVLPSAKDPALAGNWVKKGRLLNKNNEPLMASKADANGIIGKYRPSVTTIPIGTRLRAMGAFATGDGRAYVYVYIAETDQWERRIQVGAVNGAPSITIAHERVGTALVGGEEATAYNTANQARGRIVVSFKKDKYPAMLLTRFFDLEDVVDVDDELDVDRTIGITSVWHKTAGSEAIDLYQDLYTGSMRAVMIDAEGKDDDKARVIRFYPWADGTRAGNLAVRSDFEFMERHVCMGVRWKKDGRDRDDYCGDASDTVSGL